MNKSFCLVLLYALLLLSIPGCTPDVTDVSERFFFRNNGADLAVQVDGNFDSKVFVLMLHGGPGGSGFEYNIGRASQILEAEYAMVYLDQRGQGASQGSYTEEVITLQQFANDVEALVLLLKQKYGSDISVFLMGHSWGGTTGTYSLVHTNVQDHINGWIEVDGAHDIPLLNVAALDMFITIGQQQLDLGKETETWQEIVNFAQNVDPNNISEEEGGQINQYGFTAEGLLDEISYPEASPDDEYINFWTMPIGLTTYLTGNATASSITPETEVLSLTNNLSSVTTPCLFLWGRYDFVVPPLLAETAYENVSSTFKEIVYFENSGHSPMDTEPDLFAAEVINFVEQFK